MRAGRRPAQMGTKGQSNPRGMVGGKGWCSLHQGGMCAWDGATATVPDPHFHSLMAQCAHAMIVLTYTGCHATTGAPANLQVWPRGPWNTRRLVETVWSRRTTVCQSKTVGPRVWASCRAPIAWTMAAFKLLARWGLESDDANRVHLSLAEFSLS